MSSLDEKIEKCINQWIRPKFNPLGDNKCYYCTQDSENNPKCERYNPVKFYIWEDGIDIITGKLISKTTTTTQAYRFDAKKFSVEKAKEWLKDHNIKWISFEPAKLKE